MSDLAVDDGQALSNISQNYLLIYSPKMSIIVDHNHE